LVEALCVDDDLVQYYVDFFLSDQKSMSPRIKVFVNHEEIVCVRTLFDIGKE